MQVFNHTLTQMLLLFTFIIVGFLLRKLSLLPDNADTVLSKAEFFVFVPAINLVTQMTNANPESLSENLPLIFFGLLLVAVSVLLAYPISRLFVNNSSPNPQYTRNVDKYALTFGNFGFLGMPLVLGVWGSEMLFKYTLFTFFLTIVCNTWGLFILVPKDKSESVWRGIKRGLINPPVVALLIGILIGLFNLSRFVPEFLHSALSSASACQGPVAMLLAGFVIGGYKIRDMVTNVRVYIVSALRLIVIPAVMLAVLRLASAPDELMIFTLVAFASPLGLNTIVYPAAHGGETRTGAAMAAISHTLSVITIPLMYLIFIA